MKSLAGWVSVNCTVESSTAVTPLTSLSSMYVADRLDLGGDLGEAVAELAQPGDGVEVVVAGRRPWTGLHIRLMPRTTSPATTGRGSSTFHITPGRRAIV